MNRQLNVLLVILLSYLLAYWLRFGAVPLPPIYLVREDAPEDVVANERRVAEETARAEGKPEQALRNNFV